MSFLYSGTPDFLMVTFFPATMKSTYLTQTELALLLRAKIVLLSTSNYRTC